MEYELVVNPSTARFRRAGLANLLPPTAAACSTLLFLLLEKLGVSIPISVAISALALGALLGRYPRTVARITITPTTLTILRAYQEDCLRVADIACVQVSLFVLSRSVRLIIRMRQRRQSELYYFSEEATNWGGLAVTAKLLVERLRAVGVDVIT